MGRHQQQRTREKRLCLRSRIVTATQTLELMRVLRRALLMIVRFIEKEWPDVLT